MKMGWGNDKKRGGEGTTGRKGGRWERDVAVISDILITGTTVFLPEVGVAFT